MEEMAGEVNACDEEQCQEPEFLFLTLNARGPGLISDTAQNPEHC